MSLEDDILDAEETPREHTLSNLEVLSFVARQWKRRPVLFAGLVVFTAVATAADIFIPVAAGAMIDALSSGPDNVGRTH